MFNTYIKININKQEKEKLRKNAFKNKMTMSDYIRRLITIDNKLNEIKNYDNKLNDDMDDIINNLNLIRRNN